MSGITDGEIDDLREAQAEFLPETGTIKRREMFPDAETAYYPVDGVTRAMRITPGFGMWRLVADRYAGITAYTITVAWDVDIQAGDTVVVGSRVFEIRDVKNHKTYLTAIQCLADLTTDG